MVQVVLIIAQSIDGSSEASSSAIVDQTVEACNLHMQRPPPSPTSTVSGAQQYDTLELFFAGCKQLLCGIAGKKRPDYEKDWSSGEHYFGRAVKQIGLDKFSPPGFQNKSNCQLKATLITDYNVCTASAINKQNLLNNVEVEWNMLMEQHVEEAADRVQVMLTKKKSPAVTHATVVVPVDLAKVTSDEERDLMRSKTLEITRTAVERSWKHRADASYLLKDAEVEIVLAETKPQQ